MKIEGDPRPTRNVALAPRHGALIEALVKSGRYQNASEVLREGLRLIETREIEEAAKLESLRAAVDVGLTALDPGDAKEFPSTDALINYLKSVGARIVAGAAVTRKSWGLRGSNANRHCERSEAIHASAAAGLGC